MEQKINNTKALITAAIKTGNLKELKNIPSAYLKGDKSFTEKYNFEAVDLALFFKYNDSKGSLCINEQKECNIFHFVVAQTIEESLSDEAKREQYIANAKSVLSILYVPFENIAKSVNEVGSNFIQSAEEYLKVDWKGVDFNITEQKIEQNFKKVVKVLKEAKTIEDRLEETKKVIRNAIKTGNLGELEVILEAKSIKAQYDFEVTNLTLRFNKGKYEYDKCNILHFVISEATTLPEFVNDKDNIINNAEDVLHILFKAFPKINNHQNSGMQNFVKCANEFFGTKWNFKHFSNHKDKKVNSTVKKDTKGNIERSETWTEDSSSKNNISFNKDLPNAPSWDDSSRSLELYDEKGTNDDTVNNEKTQEPQVKTEEKPEDEKPKLKREDTFSQFENLTKMGLERIEENEKSQKEKSEDKTKTETETVKNSGTIEVKTEYTKDPSTGEMRKKTSIQNIEKKDSSDNLKKSKTPPTSPTKTKFNITKPKVEVKDDNKVEEKKVETTTEKSTKVVDPKVVEVKGGNKVEEKKVETTETTSTKVVDPKVVEVKGGNKVEEKKVETTETTSTKVVDPKVVEVKDDNKVEEKKVETTENSPQNVKVWDPSDKRGEEPFKIEPGHPDYEKTKENFDNLHKKDVKDNTKKGGEKVVTEPIKTVTVGEEPILFKKKAYNNHNDGKAALITGRIFTSIVIASPLVWSILNREVPVIAQYVAKIAQDIGADSNLKKAFMNIIPPAVLGAVFAFCGVLILTKAEKEEANAKLAAIGAGLFLVSNGGIALAAQALHNVLPSLNDQLIIDISACFAAAVIAFVLLQAALPAIDRAMAAE